MKKQIYGSLEGAINKPDLPKKRLLNEDIWLINCIIKKWMAKK